MGGFEFGPKSTHIPGAVRVDGSGELCFGPMGEFTQGDPVDIT